MRAPSAGIRLSRADAAIVKAMIYRGDRQSDIASYFGVNGGRIAEVSTGMKFGSVQMAHQDSLPPPGPYIYGELHQSMKQALASIRDDLSKGDTAGAAAKVAATLKKL
jgi:hypothetical protein